MNNHVKDAAYIDFEEWLVHFTDILCSLTFHAVLAGLHINVIRSFITRVLRLYKYHNNETVMVLQKCKVLNCWAMQTKGAQSVPWPCHSIIACYGLPR